MSTAFAEETTVTTKEAVKTVTPQEVIGKKYPEMSGYKRHIINLWGNYYRVNFHNRDNGRIKSHFIRFDGNSIKEYEEPVGQVNE